MSKRLDALKHEVELLRRQFLPDPFNPLGKYPQKARVEAHTRAFLVLSHAEIEEFLEEWAKKLARACEEVWKKSGRVVLPMTYLLATIGEPIPAAALNPKPGAAPSDSNARFAAVISRLFPKYYNLISENNGLKEKNLLDLFDPLGLPLAALSPTLLPNLNELGKKRGVHAHHSRKAVTSVLDPETEYVRVATVLNDLESFEKWVVKYYNAIR